MRLAGILVLLAATLPAQAADFFLLGYTRALLDVHAPGQDIAIVDINTNTKVTLQVEDCLPAKQAQKIAKQLAASPRITAVVWAPCGDETTEPPLLKQVEKLLDVDVEVTALPDEVLFDELLADPRDARFAVSYQYHKFGGREFNAGDTAFGEYFPFAEGQAGQSQYQIGLQGAVFALFNLDADSMDLVNADYWIGFPLTFRRHNWSVRARLYHQSSHVGDELLLGTSEDSVLDPLAPEDRVNLSYEAIDGLVSWDWHGLRVYAGGGYIVSSEPDLQPLLTQFGFEYRKGGIIPGATLEFAADMKRSEEQNWELNQSWRAGIGFLRERRQVHLLLQYYRGFSPNGQFFTELLEYYGLGVYFGI